MTMNLSKDRVRRAAVLLGGAELYAVLYAFGSQVDAAGATAAGAAMPRFAMAFPLALAALYALFAHALPRLTFARAEKEKPLTPLSQPCG